MLKGEIVGIFYRKSVLVIDGKKISEPNLLSLRDQKLRRKRDSGHWITNPEYSMTVRSMFND
jgi:hypothetical protein